MLFRTALILISILFFSFGELSAFTKAATVKPELIQQGEQREWCPVCGMKLKKYYKTSHAAPKHNHIQRQYCSMRCLAVDMLEEKIDINKIKVVDVTTQKFILAKDAFYIVGSDVRGTMTKVSKLAFATKEAAEDFSIEHGGELMDFADALALAQKSLTSDIAMVQKKKEKKVYPMGKRIFQKRCKEQIDIDSYPQINVLKADIKNRGFCGNLKERELQALSLYLWEVKRVGEAQKNKETIQVTKDEKCPICGMFVYKYPKWAAQIFYKQKHYSFDGVKDMMKYYFEHKKGITKMLVTDYYSQKAIDATKAYYVVGSDVYGPMGKELIPFRSQNDAKAFSMDHKGYKVIRFDTITKEDIKKLDE